MDFVPASDEEDISFPATVAAAKSNPLEDPYSFEALVAAAPRRDPLRAAKQPATTRRSPSGAHSTYQDGNPISEFTEEQPTAHRGNQTTPSSSFIAEFSTAPQAQSKSKACKRLTSESSLTSLGSTPGGRTLDEFEPRPFPVIDISDESNYDGSSKTEGKQRKPDRTTRELAEKDESKSTTLRKSKSRNQPEAETVYKVGMGIEVEVLCERKLSPHKRKAPVETVHDEPPKKKARKSATKELLSRDLALPSLADPTIPAPRVPFNDTPPSFLDAANSHLKPGAVESSEYIVSQKVIAYYGNENKLNARLAIESKATEPGKKKGKSKQVPVVDSEDDIPDADASLAVSYQDEGFLPPRYKLEPVIELTKRRTRKKVVQSDEEADFTGNAFGQSEDELLMQLTNTRRKAKTTSKDPVSKHGNQGKEKAPKSKPKSGETLLAQALNPGLVAEAPKQLGTLIDGAQDVPKPEATNPYVPHNLALAKSNPPLPPLSDTTKLSNKPPPTMATEPPKPRPKRPSMEHTIPKRRASMTLILQRAGLHTPLSSSRLTVPGAARIAPLHLNRKTPPPPPAPVPKPKKKVESEEETDEEEYAGLSERQIARLKEEKRKRAWYSP